MTKSEILEEAIRLHDEKKEAGKLMNGVAADCAVQTGLKKPQIMRLKDYSFYKGKGWEAGNPLSKEKGFKKGDKISPIFIKLQQVIQDMQAAGTLEDLKEYTEALEKVGIHITIDVKDPVAKDVKIVREQITNMKSYQLVKNEADERLDTELAEEADQETIAPKSKFKEIIGLLAKKQSDKVPEDLEDKLQEKVSFLEFYETAITNVIDDNFIDET
jgi:hypothetical protein